jgi:hypothetical protein
VAAKKPSDTKEGTAHYEKAGATLLSQQPATPKTQKVSPQDQIKWATLRGHLEGRVVMLRMWRNSWWMQNYSDLAQYIEPKRSIWLTQSTGGIPSANNMSRGRQINNAIVDPTGTYAVRVCSSGMMSGLASPSRPWFKIAPSIKGIKLDAEGRAWIDEVEDRIYTVLAGSNFYNSFAQECEDLVVFGTAPVIIYEDERDLLRCYNPVCGEYYLSSGATMRVEGLYRVFVMTVAQIVDFFGVESCPADIQKLWEQKGASLDTERIVAHSIEPNFGIQGGDAGKIPGNFAWREVYWVYGSGSEQPLSMRGFVEQPFTAARWSTQSNDAYGRSVGMDVLPDVVQLQVETARKAEAIEKMVRPPLLASLELKNQPSSILPGHVTYVSNLGPGNGMRSIYDVNPDISAMERDLAAIQDRIKKGFFNDIILMISSLPPDRRTATEISALMSERLQVLGPVIENIITESLKPKLKRVFGIMKRKNLLPPVPESMKDIPIDIEFISMLALAQKAAATGGLERLAALLGNMAAIYPDALDNLNPDNFINTFSELLDNPQSVLRSPDEVAAMRQARQQAQQKQQQAMEMSQGVNDMKVGADAASVLSDTQIGGGQTALQQLLGGV